MGTLVVVVVDVGAKDLFKVAPPEHQGPIQALRPYGPHKTLRVGVGTRRPDRGLDDFGGLRRKDLVEAGRELRVPVPDEELHRPARLGQVADQVPGDLGDECVARVLGDTEKVYPPGPVLEGEEHIEPLEEHGVHAEEVRSQDALGLGPEELCPGRASPRCWAKPMATEHAPDRCGTDPDAELTQLALGAHTTPAVVLPAQAHDQLHQFGSHRRPSRASLASPRPPFAPSGFSVPTQQRRRRDQESLPPVAREEPAQGGEEGAVGPSVPDAGMDLALKDAHLVTEDHKLDVLVSFATPGRGHKRQDPAQPEVHKGEGHGPMMTGSSPNCHIRTLIEVLAPFTWCPSTLRSSWTHCCPTTDPAPSGGLPCSTDKARQVSSRAGVSGS